MNYKTVSSILGIIALYCIMQAFGLVTPIVNFINVLGNRLAQMVAGG